jgi:hypothetical protein
MVEDLVERAADRRQRGQLFDQLVAPAHGFPALNRVAVSVMRGP